MVEQIRISPEEVRGYGNVLEEHELDDFTVNVGSLSKVSETVHGALTNTYKLLYSVYGLMFDFDKGAKQLYLQTNEADTLSLGFDAVNKQLYLVDEEDTGFSLDFDEDTNELYISDDVPPVVHNYSLALDSESYTTSGSLSVSATLLDDGVAVEGATVSFTGGVSTVTATTNSSGVATATVTFSASGTLTATYSNVSDTASVTVSQNLLLSTNKSIVSHYHSDTATLTATYNTGATVELYNANTMTKIGNFTETTSGTYTYTYSATGVGDINLVAKVGSTTSDPVTIEDCYLYAPTEISRTSTYNTDKYATMFSNFNFTSDSYLCELDIKYTNASTGFGVAKAGVTVPDNNHEIDFADSLQSNKHTQSMYTTAGSYRYDQISTNTYYTIKFTYVNGTLTVYINGTQKGSYSNLSAYNGDTREIYWYEWSSGRTTYVKNVKIKSLE